MPDLVIRPYQSADRQAVFRIGAGTAFFGAPIEACLEDRNLFLDAFYAYYTDLEPQHSWVACADGQVVGFLAGCVDTRLHNRQLLRVIIPRLAGNLLRGRYHFGKRSWHYFSGMLAGFLRGELTRVDLDAYPAHLHINVESAWRGVKLGQRLMDAWLGAIERIGKPGCPPEYHQPERSSLPVVRENGLPPAGRPSGPVLDKMVRPSGGQS
jgi:GNAT superfamily N-acetyltransferase